MARQPYAVNSSIKHIDVFGRFTGGINTQAHQENLKDDEFVVMENFDIVAGGALRNRGAYVQTNSPSVAIPGMTQGKFKHYNDDGTSVDIIAIAGKLYTYSGNTYTQLPITNLASFQTTKAIEAAQYRDTTYFATGSGLVRYVNGVASLITAYAPNGLEALYIGTNALAANPDAYLSDAVGAGSTILGVVPSTRYGEPNKSITFTAYISKPAPDVLEYQWELKTLAETDYKIVKAFGTGNKSWANTFTKNDDYMIRCSIRKQGTTVTLNQYILPKYRIQSAPDSNPPQAANYSNLSQCTKVVVHYDRLIIYGDPSNPDFLYFSHLNNFSYFPTTNVVKMIDPHRGQIQKVIQFKSFLVCFTTNSIQMITGTNPQTFVKQYIHNFIGTRSNGGTVQVMGNFVAFVGSDFGVYVLKSYELTTGKNQTNIQRIDGVVRDTLTMTGKLAQKMLSTIYDNQYYLYYEQGSSSVIYRYYMDTGVWVRDTLPFPLRTLETTDNQELYATSNSGGTIYKLVRNQFKDGTNSPIVMKLKSKDYNGGMPHHRKKIKQFQLLADLNNTVISTSVYGDNTLVTPNGVAYDLVNDPTQNSDAQKLRVSANGKCRYVKFDLSITMVENIRLIGFAFVGKDNSPK